MCWLANVLVGWPASMLAGWIVKLPIISFWTRKASDGANMTVELTITNPHHRQPLNKANSTDF